MMIKIILFYVLLIIVFYLILTEFERYVEKRCNFSFHKLIYPKVYNRINNLKYKNNSRVVICSLARNSSKYIENSKIFFEYIGNLFSDYRIVLFENDSEDNTREILKEWALNNKRITLLDCYDTFGVKDCKLNIKKSYEIGVLSKKRIEKMVMYREQYLNYVKQNYSNYEYMMVIDFDLNGNINIDGLIDTLNLSDEWDAVFINGRTPVPGTLGLSTIAYDNIAYVDYENGEYSSEEYNISKLLYNNFRMEELINKNKDKMFRVKSAFNGIGIYKIKSIIDLSYNGETNCEHTNLAKSMIEKGKKIFINPRWIGYFEKQGPQVGLLNLLIQCI
jgi:hypothetical protein